MDLPYDFGSQATKHRGVKFFVGVDDIDQVMADARAVGCRGLSRANIQAAVHLLRIGVDYLAVDARAQLHSKFALARRRGPDNHNDFGFHQKLNSYRSRVQRFKGSRVGLRMSEN
jgi:hypothetical protein